jgi:hypothetical protein
VRGGHGPTLLLLHGYPATWTEWDDILPALARHYTVVAPDLPGTGEYAVNVTGVIVPDTGHWLYEERPPNSPRSSCSSFPRPHDNRKTSNGSIMRR